MDKPEVNAARLGRGGLAFNSQLQHPCVARPRIENAMSSKTESGIRTEIESGTRFESIKAKRAHLPVSGNRNGQGLSALRAMLTDYYTARVKENTGNRRGQANSFEIDPTDFLYDSSLTAQISKLENVSTGDGQQSRQVVYSLSTTKAHCSCYGGSCVSTTLYNL
ncbi:hypothetical protein EVAR_29454_1 [Eumeta japonica]|uniref:Uncharacterized protein n=1 Tax=Eumeta variegata TaxID=151549 RepID=A0A4C1VSL2_EUMVA|nr:hypothetical protein EVAR_29454_1 [Eumeta japonica]